MDQSSITQNRRSSRSPVLLSATVQFGSEEYSVILRNLSSDGALIEGARLPPDGAVTTFVRKELSVTGTIVWVAGRYAGLRFDRQLEPAELLRQVPRPKQRFEQHFRREGLACRPLSEADRKMLEMWAAPTSLRNRD